MLFLEVLLLDSDFSSCENMTCNNVFDTGRTTLFSLICDLWFHEFENVESNFKLRLPLDSWFHFDLRIYCY